MDLVSILIPVYNVEDHIGRCLTSVAAQSYPDLEIILVNDGSSDRSGEICEAWAEKEPRIRLLHQENRGVSAARNAGLAAASGEWIIQVDSDDYIAPRTVECMIRAARETGADMVICDFERGSHGDYCFSEMQGPPAEVIDGVTAISRLYEGNHDALRFGVPWCRLCRKPLYDDIRYPDGKIFEDIYITHKLYDRCRRIAVLDQVLFYYFQRPDSIMNAAFHMKKLDYLQALVERREFFAARGLYDLERTAYDELLHSLIWEYSRTRDLLNSKPGMDYVTALYRQVYRKGYASRRYPDETAGFLAAFNRDPEWIILYWKLRSGLKRIFKRNG